VQSAAPVSSSGNDEQPRQDEGVQPLQGEGERPLQGDAEQPSQGDGAQLTQGQWEGPQESGGVQQGQGDGEEQLQGDGAQLPLCDGEQEAQTRGPEGGDCSDSAREPGVDQPAGGSDDESGGDAGGVLDGGASPAADSTVAASAQQALRMSLTAVLNSSKRVRHAIDEHKHTALIDHPVFVTITYLVILINAVQMGLELDQRPEPGSTARKNFDIMEYFAYFVFLVELILKIYFLGCKGYFRELYNVLDAVVVAVSTLDIVTRQLDLQLLEGTGTLVSCLRLVRFTRAARVLMLIRGFADLTLMLQSVQQVGKTIMSMMALLGVVCYALSILCVTLLGKNQDIGTYSETVGDEYRLTFNPFMYFGTMGRSMYTLFQLFTYAELRSVARPLFELKPAVLLIVVPFELFCGVGLTSVVVAMVVKNMQSRIVALKEDQSQQLANSRFSDLKILVRKIREVAGGDFLINSATLSSAFSNPQVMDIFSRMRVPRHFTPDDVLTLLDEHGSEELHPAEFMLAFHRLLDDDDFVQTCLTHVSAHHAMVSSRRTCLLLEEAAVSRFNMNLEEIRVRALARGKRSRKKGTAIPDNGAASPMAPDKSAASPPHDEDEDMDAAELAAARSDPLALGRYVQKQVVDISGELLRLGKQMEKRLKTMQDRVKKRILEMQSEVIKEIESSDAARFSGVMQALDRKLGAIEGVIDENVESDAMEVSCVMHYLLLKAVELTEKEIPNKDETLPSKVFRDRAAHVGQSLGYMSEMEALVQKMEQAEQNAQSDPEYQALLQAKLEVSAD